MRRLGRLRHRVTILQQAEALDSLGRQQRSAAWASVATVWAEVRDLSGNESERAKQMQITANVAVTVRHRSGLSASQRVRYAGRDLEIKAVLDADGTRRELLLMCGELK
jgi:SPP1 family predicted phage head-tail adaptor